MADKNNISSTDRQSIHNYGIDALRMLAMYMVVLAHILGAGGILEAAAPMSIQYKAAWFLEIAAYCTVNCYALISGYVGINTKYKYQSIVLLWLRTAFYTVSITLLFSIFVPGSVTLKNWIKAILPVTSAFYWYFTSYFAMFIFVPILNIAINKMNKEQLRAIVVGLIIVFSCIQTLSGKEIFSTSSNAWWLIILYIIGGYIRKYGLFKKSCALKLFIGYLLMTSLTWLWKITIEAGIFPFLESLGGNYLVNHTSPTMLAAGIFLLLIFERINPTQIANKIISFFAPMAFSVYLIHANPFIWNYLLKQRFSGYAKLSVPLEIILVLLTTLAIYIVCSFIDLIRIGIFKGLKLKQHLAKLEDKYLGHLWH